MTQCKQPALTITCSETLETTIPLGFGYLYGIWSRVLGLCPEGCTVGFRDCLTGLRDYIGSYKGCENAFYGTTFGYNPGTLGMGSSQNLGPILEPLNIRCRNVAYNQKGPIILRTTHTLIGPKVCAPRMYCIGICTQMGLFCARYQRPESTTRTAAQT